MEVYESPYPTCDKILDLFTEQNPHLEHYEILRELGLNTQNQGDTVFAMSKLRKDNHLEEYAPSRFKLGGDAITFRNQGGYKGLIERRNKLEEKEIRKEEIKEMLDEYTLKANKSVIKTNKSVSDTNIIQQRNIKLNEKLFWITLAIAIAGAIASWVQVINANENKSLKDRVEKQDTLIFSLQKQLSQIRNVSHLPKAAKDSSIVKDSTTKHHQ